MLNLCDDFDIKLEAYTTVPDKVPILHQRLWHKIGSLYYCSR